MSDKDDDSQNYALMVLAGLVFMVVGGVIALAAWRGLGGSARPASATTAAVSAIVVGEPDGRVYFELGSDALPASAMDILVKVSDAARAQPAKVVLISGFHDASGDAATNAALAKKRAETVRHALESNGVAPERLVLDKPMVTQGDGDSREARRVEMRLR